MAFQKKASTSSEVVLGSAVAEMKKVTVAIANATSQVEGLAERAESLQLEIASREDRIKELDVTYEEIHRQKKVDLELTLKADREKAAVSIIEAQGKVVVVKEELENLKSSLSEYKESFDEKLKAEIGKVQGIMNSNYENRIKLMEAEYKAKEAGNVAKIESLDHQVKAQTAEIERLYKAIEAEREASVKRAEASRMPAMTIGGSGYGK